jgi:hypothetical protein
VLNNSAALTHHTIVSPAGTYQSVFSQLSTPRTDCPTSLPSPPSLRLNALDGSRPLNGFQESMVQAARSMLAENGAAADQLPQLPRSEREARAVHDAVQQLLGRLGEHQ